MPVSQQAKLLRALQEGTVRRLGSGTDMTVDARVIAAINVEPGKAMKEGHLRCDLFYRLSVFIIEVPPLRERPGDALLLARHFASEFAKAQDKRPPSIDTEASSQIPIAAPTKPTAIATRHPPRDAPTIAWPREPHTPAINRRIKNSKNVIGYLPSNQIDGVTKQELARAMPQRLAIFLQQCRRPARAER